MNTPDDGHAAGRQRKRLRKDSCSDFSIEELFPDDIGYDADIEALHPDTYEEPDSEAEPLNSPKRKFHSVDDELASRMKHLGSERSGTNSPLTPTSMRGRKRRSLHEDLATLGKEEQSDLEVMEVPAVADRSAKSPPQKRRKRSRPSSSRHRPDGLLVRSAQHVEPAHLINNAQDVMDLT